MYLPYEQKSTMKSQIKKMKCKILMTVKDWQKDTVMKVIDIKI